MTIISYPARLQALAAAAPDRLAVTCGDVHLTRAELEERADTFARHLQSLGVKEGDLVTLALPNSEAWFIAMIAVWKLGATPQPVSPRLPALELAAIVELAGTPLVLGTDVTPESSREVLNVAEWLAAHPEPAGGDPLPDKISKAWKAPTSGGSTGRPKLIVSGDPAQMDDEMGAMLGHQQDGALVMPGPLYHNGPLIWSCHGLFYGNHVVVLPKFEAEATLDAVQRYKADIIYLVPTMMKRIWRMPIEERESYDMSSLRIVWHLAEPCPGWLKEAWIDWLGPERIVELYGGTEGQLACVISGVEWLEHHGSVGRPMTGELMICDADGKEVPVGEDGEVWMRSAPRSTPTYTYIGAEARTLDGGWESLGDNGHLDADGYLYLGDRVGDMILSGGANIYPAEIEAALQEHPSIESCAVIGLPDEDFGNRVHAIVQADAAAFDQDAVLAFLAERLVRYKLPRTFEVVGEPLRDDAGKVRRSELKAQRV